MMRIAISDKAPLQFDGVTIRKAMLGNGDYVDLKAFSPNPDSPLRQFLTSLKAYEVLETEGEISLSKSGFRQIVISLMPVVVPPMELGRLNVV